MNVLNETVSERFAMYQGDCVQTLEGLPENGVHYALFSPPFASLYTYSNSDRDMGNSRDGFIGVKDFRGDIIRSFTESGFIFHSEVTIWKNPVTEMQRTKALGLLHKQIRKDSSMSRQGLPDYVVTFRKPGENPEPIAHDFETFPVDVWQRYASPVWMDIRQSNTLNRAAARGEKDEKHICPLQLDVIERCIELWTNPDDIVLDPFAGIGSVPYQAVKMGRRGLGVELKEEYYRQAAQNLQKAEADYKEHGAPETVLLRCPNCGIKIPGTVCPICGAEL